MSNQNAFPKEINTFNWGALLLGWFWAFVHKFWAVGFCIFMLSVFDKIIVSYDIWLCVYGFGLKIPNKGPLLNLLNALGFLGSNTFLSIFCFSFITKLILSIFIGIKGNEMIWKKGIYKSFEDLKRVEFIWLRISYLICFLYTGFLIYTSILIVNYIVPFD